MEIHLSIKKNSGMYAGVYELCISLDIGDQRPITATNFYTPIATDADVPV